MQTKHDISSYKQEFINSEFNEVKSFFEDKWMTYNSQIRKYTKGRTKEKQELKAKIVEDSIKKSAKKQANELAVPLEELMKWKKAIIQLLLQQVAKYVKESKNKDWTINEIDIWNAERILKMFKTELWEPSTIWTNYNLNANKVEWLTEEELEALDILFWKAQNWKKSKE